MLESILSILLVIYIAICLFVVIGLLILERTKPITKDFPSVSVLISCRNEEIDLPSCITSLTKLDYPKDQLQVILVDDHSTDSTASILQNAASQYDHFEFYSYTEFEETHLKAKARGISRAASRARGDWLFITDADGQIPSTWIKHMLWNLKDDCGMIVGMTETINSDLLSSLEKTAGIFTLPFGFGLAGWGLKLIGLGPNMAVRRRVYEKAGGLEGAHFEVAEDMAIFKMAQDNKSNIIYRADQYTTIKLAPVPSYEHLLSQQRRWVRGGFQGGVFDWIVFMILLSFALTFSLVYLANWFIDLEMALLTTFMLLFAQGVLLAGVKFRTKARGILRLVPLSVVYTLISFIWLPLSFLFNRKIRWIGNNYEVKYE